MEVDRPPIRPRRSSARLTPTGLGLIAKPSPSADFSKEGLLGLPGAFPVPVVAGRRKSSAASATSSVLVQAGLATASASLTQPRSASVDISPKLSNRRAQISGIPTQHLAGEDSGKLADTTRRISKVGDGSAGSIKVQITPSPSAARPESFGVKMDALGSENTYVGQGDYATKDGEPVEERRSSIPITPPLRIMSRKKTPPKPLEVTNLSREYQALNSAHSRTSTVSTAPSTPPCLTHSVYSDSLVSGGDGESVRSSLHHTSWPVPSIARKLDFNEPINSVGTSQEIAMAQPLNGDVTPKMPTLVAPDDALPTALACLIEQEPDLPGMLRRESGSSTGSEVEDDEESDNEFSLEDFPVPSSVIGSPLPPTAVSASPMSDRQGIAVKTFTTIESTPRPDLFQLDSAQSASMTWSLADELEIRDRVFRAEMKAMSRSDKLRRRELRQHFSETAIPSRKDMYEASLLSVRDEYGNRIRFGSLFEGQRTIVCFIRHFWCSMCQSYVDAIAKVKPAVLDKYGLRLIIISNGSWKMIKGYKKLLGDRCPYPIYTDRSKHVYTALGMTLRTFNAGKDAKGRLHSRGNDDHDYAWYSAGTCSANEAARRSDAARRRIRPGSRSQGHLRAPDEVDSRSCRPGRHLGEHGY